MSNDAANDLYWGGVNCGMLWENPLGESASLTPYLDFSPFPLYRVYINYWIGFKGKLTIVQEEGGGGNSTSWEGGTLDGVVGVVSANISPYTGNKSHKKYPHISGAHPNEWWENGSGLCGTT